MPLGPPQGLEIITVTSHLVMFRWLLPLGVMQPSDIHGYLIHYRYMLGYPTPGDPSDLDATLRTVNITGADNTVALLSGLPAGQRFSVKVAAYDERGIGPFSENITIVTPEALPSAAPRDLSAQAASSTEIYVSWAPPSPSTMNGRLLGYVVFVRSLIDQSVQEIQVAVDANNILADQEITVENLDKFVDYEISVVAVNSVGNGPPAPVEGELVIRTLADGKCIIGGVFCCPNDLSCFIM